MEEHLAGRLDRWRTLPFDALPDDVVSLARHCALDWIGCTIAGSREPLVGILGRELAEEAGGSVGRAGGATVVGGGRRLPGRSAALLNGTAGHALDFDDTHQVMSGHPTAPVMPAALATAEELDLPTERLLTALVAGIELECRVGALMGGGPYRAGWHATGTMGTFGAATAAANLLQLDQRQWGHAIGLAGTSAAGLKASFGTMAKPLHAGKAAADGVLAARLAGRGFTANPAVVEARQGLSAASGGRPVELDRLTALDDKWLIRETLFKYHAACYLTHASINAAMALRPEVRPDAVRAVAVRVAPGSLDVCAIPSPVTGLEGKFSLRATTAMALLGDDTADLRVYTDERMAGADLVALRDLIEVVPDDSLTATKSVVEVRLDDGRCLRAHDDTGRPAEDLARQRERLTAKFRTLAGAVVGAERAGAIVEAVNRIGTGPSSPSVRELTGLLR
ncbi:MAG: hypothetical protein QOG64_2698 [Acidimicrobiaceae bacterium]|nr:hypothetical protein [Acidimicrobiaceae bacterium]